MTEERKKQILKWATMCFVEDETEPDGVKLARPSICNDEEWEWLSKGYQEAKNKIYKDNLNKLL